jgi:predicted ABC-type ATPase
LSPKFRLFGGPNGSGKTFLFDRLRKSGTIHTELYINADKILRDINLRGNFNFNAYHIKCSESEFKNHVLNSGLFARFEGDSLLNQIHIIGGILKFDFDRKMVNAYHASFISSYLVNKLFETGQSFCFETVMSHESKLALFHVAKSFKYKTYLYFVFTDNPELNIARVKLRAAAGLHDVDANKVKERYERTFELLPEALKTADEAYIIDNSFEPTVIIEKHGKTVSKILEGPLTEKVRKAVGHLITISDNAF